MSFPLSSLSNDILLCIADYVDSERGINAFARTSRRFYRLLNDYLYRYNVTKSRSSALIWAARRGQLGTAAHSIGQGGNVGAGWNTPDYQRTRYYVSLSPDKDIIDLLEQNRCFYCTPVYAASLGGYTEIVDLLVHHGANIEVDLGSRGSPLQAAAQYGHLSTVRRLLAEHRNIDKPGPDKSRTALHAACLAGQDRVVQCLIEAGANVMALDDELQTPLHLTLDAGDRFSIGRLRTVQWLLVSGADKDAYDRRGKTPADLSTKTKGTDLSCLFSNGYRIEVYEAGAQDHKEHKQTSLQRLWKAYLEKQTEAATETARLKRLQAEAEATRARLNEQRQLETERRRVKDHQAAAEEAKKSKEAQAKALQAQKTTQQMMETAVTPKQDAARKTWAGLRARAESTRKPLDAEGAASCKHVALVWKRRKGKADCRSCQNSFAKCYFFQCPDCERVVCQDCMGKQRNGARG